MSAPAAAAVASAAYWRAAGMSYLKYANLCAEVVRASLKEPFLTKAKSRESVYFRSTPFESGKPGKSGVYASEDGFSRRTLGFTSAHAGAALTLSSVITETKRKAGRSGLQTRSLFCGAYADQKRR